MGLRRHHADPIDGRCYRHGVIPWLRRPEIDYDWIGGNTSVNRSRMSFCPLSEPQFWASSAIMVLVAVRTTPASCMRRRDISSESSNGDPEASMTACTL